MLKTCKTCAVPKPLDRFSPHKTTRSGLFSMCKQCCSAKSKAWQAANKERAAATQRDWIASNREWFNARTAAAMMKRKAAKVAATPAWADHDKIRAVYLLAARMRDAGEDVEVDHIVPLQGDIATGFHTHTNLQIIPAKVNRSKKNRVDVDAYKVPHA